MKSLKLKKIVAAAVAALTIASVTPVGASAAWKQDSNGWWNTEGNSYSIGWRLIDGAWYYFDSVGYMKTGWVNDNGTWYYLQASGAMKTGWVNDNGTWYYLQASGAMKTGWINDNGTWYYLQPSGAMKTGWIYDNGTWYFAAASGAMQTGVVEVDGKIYYLAASGAMQTGTVVIDGVTYTFAPSGEAIGDKKPTPKLFFTSTGVSVKAPSDTGKDTTSSSSGGSHHSSGGSGTTPTTPTTPTDAQQAAIDTKYAKEAVIPEIKPILSADGKTATIDIASTLAPELKSELGQPAKIVTMEDGTQYLVKKDITISTSDGTDAGITPTGLGQYTVKAGTKGTVTAVLSLLNTKTGQLYYVGTTATPFQA